MNYTNFVNKSLESCGVVGRSVGYQSDYFTRRPDRCGFEMDNLLTKISLTTNQYKITLIEFHVKNNSSVCVLDALESKEILLS